MSQELQSKIESIISRSPQADEREIVLQLRQLLHETELQNSADRGAKNISDLVAESMRQLDEEIIRSAVVKTGFDDFDAEFGGFRLGEFVVIGGRPSMGKTQLLVNLSLHISKTFPVLYVTFDLSAFLLTCRFMSSVSGIPAGDILQHDLSEKQRAKLATVGNELAGRQLFIAGECANSIAALTAHCQRQIRENGVQVVVVDYLQLIDSYSKYGRANRDAEVSHICRELKNMANEYNVCVIVSSQLNRSVESRYGSKRPQLSDLRESGAIEQDADKVLFIYRPEYYGFTQDEEGSPAAGVVELIMAKNRIGRLGTIKLHIDSNFTNFQEHKKEFAFASERLRELGELLELEKIDAPF